MTIDPVLKKAIEERISANFSEEKIVTELVEAGYKKTDAEAYYALVSAKVESMVSSKIEKTKMHVPEQYKKAHLSVGMIVLLLCAALMIGLGLLLLLTILDIIELPYVQDMSVPSFDWSRLNPSV